MSVNYVLSFCKITAASKVFSRNFYLPLLKPVTPKDAVRTFRITGKWLLGSKIQHYIPALLNHTQKRPKNKKDYGKVSHKRQKDFKYLSPELDPENETHQALLNILNNKQGDGMFVYTVEDIKCNIVVTAPFELAIRDGDIIDILVAQRNDKIIIKMSDSKKIPLEITPYLGENNMCKGEGATTEEEEKNHHHGKYAMSIAKVFEEKERQSEEWEMELQKIVQKRKKQAWEDTIEWDDMVRESVNKLDWKKFEKEAKKVIETIADPISERHIEMEVEDLALTKYANETLMSYGVCELPTIKEINDVVKSMPTAIPHSIEAEIDDEETIQEPKPKTKRRVSGVKVTLSTGRECFITGQMVHTDDGEVFVPGQTIQNENGDEYAPGITINMDNKPLLVSGLIMGDEENEPMFLPTESAVTSDGQLIFSKEPEERPKPPAQKKEKHKFVTSFAQTKEEPEPAVAAEETQIQEVASEEPKPKKRRKKNVKKKKEEEKKEEEKPIVVEEAIVPIVEIEIQSEEDKEKARLAEQERLELERLEQRLMDDGMDEVVASVQSKEQKLRQKLDEMRKLRFDTENDLISYASIDDAMEVAENIVDNAEIVYRIAEILLTITRRAASFRDKHSINTENINGTFTINDSNFITDADEKFEAVSDKLKVLLKTVMVAANDVYKTRPKDQLLALHTLGEIVSDTLKQNRELIEELCQLMNTTVERNEICTTIFRQLTQSVRENKVDALKAAIKTEDELEILDKIILALDNQIILAEAFAKLSRTNKSLLKDLIGRISLQIDDIVTEHSVVELLQKEIISLVRKLSQDELIELFRETDKEFLCDAAIFCRTLGMHEVADDIQTLASTKSVVNVLESDECVLEQLKRFVIVRQLTAKDYYLKAALDRLKKNPECGETDSRIKQLVRQSAVLLYERIPLRNSREIPLKVMKLHSSLAIDDFLIRRSNISYPVMVCRQGLQTVIPREAERSVMAGRVPYLLVDESGLTNFRPVDAFTSGKYRKRDRSMEAAAAENKDNKRLERSSTPKLQGQVRDCCCMKLNKQLALL